MNKDKLFGDLKVYLQNRLTLLADKPEETIDSTLKALWFAASGNPISVAAVSEQNLSELTDVQVRKLNVLIQDRINNTPLAHITGKQRFMGIDFLSDNRALIPRKETEILGYRALELSVRLSQGKQNINIIDVCCGAGNLGLAIASINSKAVVFSTDISHEAVDLTRDNISFLNLRNEVVAEQGDLFSAAENDHYFENVDLIVCNPPYISTGKVKNMNPEIADKEPVLAFDGGMFGTKVIQRLIQEAPKFLKKGGWLVFEVGVGQGNFIIQLCKKTNLYNQVEHSIDDYGNIRVVSAMK